jgi:plastocyanin
MRISRSAVVLLILAAAPASAVELDVLVDDGHGRPAEDAVISVRSGAGATPSAYEAATHIIDQRNERFIPYVEIFRPGDKVVFRNSDSTRHHVYSFSAAKSFEFVIAPGVSAPAVTLDQAGEISVGCNIHDRMITHLFVSDAPWTAKSHADGHARFADLRPGRYEISVWHPQLRPGKGDPHQTIDIGASTATATFSVPLLPDPRGDADDREKGRY